jgi:hypothetical protein
MKTKSNSSYWQRCLWIFLGIWLFFSLVTAAGAQGPASGFNSKKVFPSTTPPSMPKLPLVPGASGITNPSSISNAKVYDFSPNPDLSSPTSFPGGTLSGGGIVEIVGTDWFCWSPNTPGKHVLFEPGMSVDIFFGSSQGGVGVKAQPNDFGLHSIAIEAFDSTGNSLGSFTRTSISGNCGAAFLGIASSSNNIARVKITSDATSSGFAFTDLTFGLNPPPEVPEADTLLLMGSGLGGLATWLGWQWRKARSRK